MKSVFLFLAAILFCCSSSTLAFGDTAKADNGSVAIVGDSNTVGITEEEYRKRLETDTEALREEVRSLEQRLYAVIRDEGHASGRAEELAKQRDTLATALADAEEKLLDIDTAYADLQVTVAELTTELSSLRDRQPGRIPKDVFEEAIAALQKGDLTNAERLIEPLLEVKSVEDIIRDQAQLYYISGQIAQERFDYQTAKERYIRAAELAPDVIIYLQQASAFSGEVADYRKAEQLARDWMALLDPQDEVDEVELSAALSALGLALNSQGRYEEAGPLYRKALDIRVDVLGDAHPSSAKMYNNVASNLNAQGRHTEAESLFQKAVSISRSSLGSTHSQTIGITRNQIQNLIAQDKLLQADAVVANVFGADHPQRADLKAMLAFSHYKASAFDLAEPLWVEAIQIGAANRNKGDIQLATWRQNLAKLYYKQGRFDESYKLYSAAFPVFLQTYIDDEASLAHLAANYARLLRDAPTTAQRSASLRALQQRFGDHVGTTDYKP